MNSTAFGVGLVADVGGTHIRFAISKGGELLGPKRLAAEQFLSIEEAVDTYTRHLPASSRPDRAVVAVAAPLGGRDVRLTNSSWSFRPEGLRQRFGWQEVLVVNDFEALALALPLLKVEDLLPVREGEAEERAALALLGPGTGLGVSGLLPTPDGWVPIRGEGGHADLAPATAREWELIQELQERYGHVSAERVLSGSGLVSLYRALANLEGREARDLSPEEVVAGASGPSSRHLEREAVRMFSGWLGAVAGDLALMLGARGGVYLGGGMLLRMGACFDSALFEARFLAKGRFAVYLAPIPVNIVNSPWATLLGAASLLGREENA